MGWPTDADIERERIRALDEINESMAKKGDGICDDCRKAPFVGFSDDGEALCEDCLLQWGMK